MKKAQTLGLISLVFILLSATCSEVYLPKPKGFNRIDMPVADYQSLQDTFPYHFQYSKYANISRDTFHLAGRYWINLNYSDYGALVQLTYKNLRSPSNDINLLLDDAYELSARHNIKAYSIEESILSIQNGQKASVIELEGEVPSQFQFFTTDTTNHFLRGALYFNVADKNDSLSPIIEFIKADVIQMLNTLEWKY